MKTKINSIWETLRVSAAIASISLTSLCHAAPEWLIVTGDSEEDERTSDNKVVNIPAGRSAILVVALASAEYPSYTGPSSEFNDILEWDIELSAGDGVNGSVDVNNRHSDWEIAELEGTSLQGFSPVHIERMVGLTAPDDAQLTVTLEAAATNIGDGALPSTVIIGVLPIKTLELHPELLDGSDAAIPNSQVPRIGIGETNGMTERRTAHSYRIAYRELKIEVEGADDLLEDKTVTWTLDPLFVPVGGGGPTFRGDWAQAVEANSRNRFEVSAQYGAYEYALGGQASSTTELDDSGQSAIRVNLPPIGLNKGRAKIEIEDVDGDSMNVIDMEVPAVVVIDAGHGGTDPGAVSGGVEEADLTLDYSAETRTELIGLFSNLQPFHRVVMTRTGDTTVSLTNRPQVARDQGADIFLSIHFNSSTNATASGTETLIRGNANVNTAEDTAYATRIQNAAVGATGNPRTPGVKNYAGAPGILSTWAVLSDTHFANNANFHPIRGCIQEVEFITNPTIRATLTDPTAGPALRSAFATGVSAAIVTDIQTQP